MSALSSCLIDATMLPPDLVFIIVQYQVDMDMALTPVALLHDDGGRVICDKPLTARYCLCSECKGGSIKSAKCRVVVLRCSMCDDRPHDGCFPCCGRCWLCGHADEGCARQLRLASEAAVPPRLESHSFSVNCLIGEYVGLAHQQWIYIECLVHFWAGR
jgi:hypothetical protein